MIGGLFIQLVVDALCVRFLEVVVHDDGIEKSSLVFRFNLSLGVHQSFEDLVLSLRSAGSKTALEFLAGKKALTST